VCSFGRQCLVWGAVLTLGRLCLFYGGCAQSMAVVFSLRWLCCSLGWLCLV